MIPLQSYANSPPENKFAGLDYFEFRMNNDVIPPEDTTYYCKVFKAPTEYPTKRHAIAHKTMIDPNNIDIVHHLVFFACRSTAKFDDNNLPYGVCDEHHQELSSCFTGTATIWAVGGEPIVEFPEEAGYPIGGDFGSKYYMLEMHYNNQKLTPNRRDNTGIRFYIGQELRQYYIGYLAFGTTVSVLALAIPPKNIPESGITVVSSYLHTHLQGTLQIHCNKTRAIYIHIGVSLSTKLIRNNTAVRYMFNGEMYDFNYQFDHRLPEPIKLYPGDEFATQCVYNTMNKNTVTLGGQRTTNEMFFHQLTYYSLQNNLYACFTLNHPDAWHTISNRVSTTSNHTELVDWINTIEWTPTLAAQWQEFYNHASRLVTYSIGNNSISETLDVLPKYKGLQKKSC
ncbi:unnamed protein product [Rotaria socialis]